MIAHQPRTRRRFLQWSLRTLGSLFVPVCAVLAYYGHVERQKRMAQQAFDRLLAKVVNANFADGTQHAVVRSVWREGRRVL